MLLIKYLKLKFWCIVNQMDTNANFWRICSSCKRTQIAFGAKYYECSVSTCTGKRTGYVFCSVQCFETHLPGARHRDAAAVECFAPSRQQAMAENSAPSVSTAASTAASSEVLVVVSKMKQYIKDKADMNTSGDVADILSVQMRRACDRAIEVARADGRKTVMAKDFK
jgi:histone H3/H4